MTFRLYLYIMAFASVAAWLAWILVINTVNPVKTGVLGYSLFYGTLAIAFIGTFSLLGAGLRSWSQPGEHPSRHTLRSFRQGIILSLLILSVLMMLSANVLRWWSLLLGVFIAGLCELTILSFQKKT